MKKIIYLIGAFVTVAAIFTAIAIMLKKLKVSLSIEGIDDELVEEDNADIDISIEDVDFDESEDAVEEAIKEMLDDEDKEIDVEITEL